jgi:hypothetical protein
MILAVGPHRDLGPIARPAERRWLRHWLDFATTLRAPAAIPWEGDDMAEKHSMILMERVERRIYFIRGEKVMLDSDLAELYGVPTRALNQAVRRNGERFPRDFMFQLTGDEAQSLRSQTVILKRGEHRKYRPYAFTEQGVAMLSSVLRSPRAIRVNIEIMRTFVRLRKMLGSNAHLARKLKELEQKYDSQFRIVFDAIRHLMEEPPEEDDPSRSCIGFTTEDEQRHRATRARAARVRAGA